MPTSEVSSFLDLRNCDCATCGYNLYGTIAASRSKCPECGTTYRLTVAVTRRGMSAWYVMVVAASVLFGGSSLYLAYIFVRGYRNHLSDLEVNAMLLVAPLSLLLVMLLGLKREWLVRRPVAAVWLASSVLTALTLAFLMWWVGLFVVL